MRSPHCGKDVKPKGPNCPACGQRIFGSGGALDSAPATPTPAPTASTTPAAPLAAAPPPKPAAPSAAGDDSGVSLAVDVVADLGDTGDDISLDLDAELDEGAAFASPEMKAAAPAESVEPAAAAEGTGWTSVDLDAEDAVEAQEERERARAAELQESMVTEDRIRSRRETAFVEESAESLYDESLMGGLYIGGLVGALAGYFQAKGSGGSIWVGPIVGAVLGALVGLAIGVAVGRGGAAGVRTNRGQAFLIGLGIVLLAGPVIAVLVALMAWGFGKHPMWAALSYLVLAFAFFALTWQDARRRQAEGPLTWGLVVAALPPLLGLYYSRRPHGELVQCGSPQCGEWHLAAQGKCPFCGYVHRAGVIERHVEL